MADLAKAHLRSHIRISLGRGKAKPFDRNKWWSVFILNLLLLKAVQPYLSLKFTFSSTSQTLAYLSIRMKRKRIFSLVMQKLVCLWSCDKRKHYTTSFASEINSTFSKGVLDHVLAMLSRCQIENHGEEYYLKSINSYGLKSYNF